MLSFLEYILLRSLALLRDPKYLHFKVNVDHLQFLLPSCQVLSNVHSPTAFSTMIIKEKGYF